MTSILLAFPSTASFAQQAALAFYERGQLAAYMTAFAYRSDGCIARLLKLAPSNLGARVDQQLKRRSISTVPRHALIERPFWEVVRTVCDKAGVGAVAVDRLWDHLSYDFTRAAARRVRRGGLSAVYAYEYTALEAFRAADRVGAAKILDFPSLNSRQFEELQRREKERYPELIGAHDAYFSSRFQQRQARRDSEMRAADIIITNSSVTRRSHIDAGAHPSRTFAVPYGAPPTIESVPERSVDRPLRVIWAGTFSLRKGAHYFVEAWRKLNADAEAVADIYGAVVLPDRLWKPAPRGMHFHGSVVRQVLFDAYAKADVLVFPTLSDGFGMVVTEAFARGLPVITTDQAGASDLVKHNRNGIVIPAGDAKAIETALRWCLNNRDRLAAMRSPALQTAKNWQWSDYRQALAATVAQNVLLSITGSDATNDVILHGL